MSVTHAYSSAVADGADTTKVRPSNWNAAHTIGDGTEAAPGIAFTSDPDVGFRLPAANRIIIITAGADRWEVDASGHLMASDDNTYDIGASAGTSPRTLYLGTNLVFRAASASIVPGATSLLFRNNANNATNLTIADAGTMTTRAGLVMGGAITWTTDNASDIGASGATRPRIAYLGTALAVGTNPAAAGAARLAHDASITWRNSVNSGDAGTIEQDVVVNTLRISYQNGVKVGFSWDWAGDIVSISDNGTVRPMNTTVADGTGHLTAGARYWRAS